MQKKPTRKQFEAVKFLIWQNAGDWPDHDIIALASDLLGMVSRRMNGEVIIDHSKDLER